MITDVLPVVVEMPGMESVGGGVFPKDGVGAVDVCSSESLPPCKDTLVDLLSAIGDGDGVSTVYGDGIEAGGGFF